MKHIVAASASSLASWLKSSEEKPTTTSPLALYFWYASSSPLNCGVKPQWLAVFTMSTGLPATSVHRFTLSEECSLRYSWFRKAGHDSAADAVATAETCGTGDKCDTATNEANVATA